MTTKEYLDYLESIKTKMMARSSRAATNCGFRQIMKRLNLINLEIKKIEKGDK